MGGALGSIAGFLFLCVVMASTTPEGGGIGILALAVLFLSTLCGFLISGRR